MAIVRAGNGLAKAISEALGLKCVIEMDLRFRPNECPTVTAVIAAPDGLSEIVKRFTLNPEPVEEKGVDSSGARAWFWMFEGFAADEGKTMYVKAEPGSAAPILAGQWRRISKQLLDIEPSGFPKRAGSSDT